MEKDPIDCAERQLPENVQKRQNTMHRYSEKTGRSFRSDFRNSKRRKMNSVIINNFVTRLRLDHFSLIFVLKIALRCYAR